MNYLTELCVCVLCETYDLFLYVGVIHIISFLSELNRMSKYSISSEFHDLYISSINPALTGLLISNYIQQH